MLKNILLVSMLCIYSSFYAQNPDYVFVSSGMVGDLSSIFKINLNTCQKDVIVDKDTLIYDIAFNHLTNKLIVMYKDGPMSEYDLFTYSKKDLGVWSWGNGLTFDLEGGLFYSSWDYFKTIDLEHGETGWLGRFDAEYYGGSSGDITFINNRLFLSTTKGYILEFNLNDISNPIIFTDTRLLNIFGISSTCNNGFYLYDDNDIYKMSIDNPENISLVCENIVEGVITGASSIFEHPVEVQILNDSAVCPNVSEFTLNVNGYYSEYEWSTGEISNVITIGDTGVYWVKQKNFCQESMDSIHIVYRDLPQVSSLDSSAKCFPLKLNLNNSNYQYQWFDHSSDTSIVILKPGDYWLTINDGFCTDTSFFQIIKEEGLFEYPNVVTPNSDGKNDFFKIVEDESNPIKLEVYNRWGTLIFQSEDYQNNWPNDVISSGTYFYTTQIGECFNKSWVQIIK